MNIGILATAGLIVLGGFAAPQQLPHSSEGLRETEQLVQAWVAEYDNLGDRSVFNSVSAEKEEKRVILLSYPAGRKQAHYSEAVDERQYLARAWVAEYAKLAE